ncbi:TM2 domain-containing protein [Kocuria massiliensis]|uniref:TM2 domain-containing protein n=1 Tax=Kocuria massiliensis TaxID=1926282 RepID=UPI0022B9BC2B|nr:TM2 domain-containing protein [Kocuria massiliensis]
MGNLTKMFWSIAAAGHLHTTGKIREAIDAQNAAMGIKTPSQIRAEERAAAIQKKRDAAEEIRLAKAAELKQRRATETPRTVRGAYLWWLISVFGIFGGHYFYLGLPTYGTAAIFTGGFFTCTSWLDPFRMSKLVAQVNNGER